MEEILVSDIMTRDPIVAKPTYNLLECARLMVRKRVGSLPIVENKKLVGFITQKDILWALVKKPQKDLSKILAKDISPKKIITTRPSESVKKAFNKMKKVKFNRLPVLYKGNFVGVVTIRDILTFVPELLSEIQNFVNIRESEEKLKRIESVHERSEFHEGFCEECGNFGDLSSSPKGALVCRGCMER